MGIKFRTLVAPGNGERLDFNEMRGNFLGCLGHLLVIWMQTLISTLSWTVKICAFSV